MNLPTLGDLQRTRRAQPKPVPHQVTKEKTAKAKQVTDKKFRDRIWALDGGKSRATGKSLSKSGMTWHEIGEVDHGIPRSLAPDRIYDVSNALLLSKWENRMRKVPCVRAPEFKYFDYTGPDDRRQPQTFVWRDDDGKIVKTRIG